MRAISTRAITDADKIVSARVRQLRLERRMSQEALASKLSGPHGSLTFQQLQKYEKATNRISVGRLVQIAQALSVPVEWFLRDISDSDGTSELDGLQTMLSAPDGMTLAKAFKKLTKNQRIILLDIATAFVKGNVYSGRAHE